MALSEHVTVRHWRILNILLSRLIRMSLWVLGHMCNIIFFKIHIYSKYTVIREITLNRTKDTDI